MRAQLLLPVLAGLAGLAHLASEPPDAPGGEAPPNVLIVLWDDVAERDLDRISTPTFDAFAREGLRFRRAYASPVCSPARWGLVFGRYRAVEADDPCGGHVGPNDPPTSLASLPEVLAAAGYATALFGKWHLGGVEGVPWERAPTAHGFATWRAGIGSNLLGTSCPRGLRGRGYRDWYRVDDGVGERSRKHQTIAVREAFLAWHAEVDGQGPWFALLAFQAAHVPLEEPPGARLGARPSRRELYKAMVKHLDRVLADVLAAVDPARTLVVVTADNGTPFDGRAISQESGKLKGTTYEDGVRVPMAWRGPGVAAGRETSSLVAFVDLLPTLAELAGASAPEAELDGTSLVPLLRDPERSVRDYVWLGYRRAPWEDLGVVTSGYKYREASDAGEPARAFLFDLEVDPSESVNLVDEPEQAERVASLRALLARHP